MKAIARELGMDRKTVKRGGGWGSGSHARAARGPAAWIPLWTDWPTVAQKSGGMRWCAP